MAGCDVDDLPPGVADAARWRWRRHRLDRDDFGGWRAFLTVELPGRVKQAGPRPADALGFAETPVAALFRAEGRLPPTSKRRRSQAPRAPKAPSRQRRSRTPDNDDEVLDAVLIEHGVLIRRLAGDGADARTVRRLAALLHRVLSMPDDPDAGEAWRRAVAESATR